MGHLSQASHFFLQLILESLNIDLSGVLNKLK